MAQIQVLAAHHLADAQAEFIHGGGQVVRKETIGAAQHHVAHLAGAIKPARGAKALPPEDQPGSQAPAPAGQAIPLRRPAQPQAPAVARIHRRRPVGGGDVGQQPAAA
ncbi:MAG: hypothetical protein ACKOCI_05730, partial [Cyanobium sp.]